MAKSNTKTRSTEPEERRSWRYEPGAAELRERVQVARVKVFGAAPGKVVGK